MDNIYIPIILGTGRKDRESIKVANLLHKSVLNLGIQTNVIDVKDYGEEFTIPTWVENSKAQPFAKHMNDAHAVIIVSPEYNHGYPGELKLMFDAIYDEFARKPVGIVGVSDGGIGGARVVEMLRLVVIAAKMVPISNALYFPNVDKMFDDKQNYLDKEFDRRFNKFIEELLWYTKVLKNGRDSDLG